MNVETVEAAKAASAVPEDFGQILKRLRETRRLSQSKLAELANFDHSYISRLESGAREPTRDSVTLLKHALDEIHPVDDDESRSLFHTAGFLLPGEIGIYTPLTSRVVMAITNSKNPEATASFFEEMCRIVEERQGDVECTILLWPER